jgi:zinc protease
MRKIVLSLLILTVAIVATAQTGKVDRSKAPALGPVAQLKVPAEETFQLSNGLTVYFLRKAEVPLIQLNLFVKAGSAYESAEKLGLASLTSNMLDEGAGTRNALEIADEIDYLGISLSSFTDSELMGVRLFSPTSKLDAALALMSDLVLKPTFPEKELSRIRKELLVSLAQQHDEARIIASRTFAKVLFGDAHPLGRPTAGTEQSVKSFSVSDVQNFYNTYFVAGNAYIVAVGDITADALKAKLEKSLGGMKQGTANAVTLSNPKQVSKRVIYLVDKPGAAQSEIRIGRIGVTRDTKDYYNLMVMNTILGGSFTSRLNQNLRETHGYSYGAGSNFVMRKTTGYFLASSSVQTDVTDKALTEFFKELNAISKTITDDEVTRARNYLALGYPADFASVQSMVGALSEKIQYQLPSDYFNQYVPNILAVKKADVLRVAKNIDTANIAVVVIGDRAKIEAGIKALNLGEIRYLSIADVLGPLPATE